MLTGRYGDAMADYHDVQTLMIGVWDANRKLDEIIGYLRDEDDGEEEEETDLDG